MLCGRCEDGLYPLPSLRRGALIVIKMSPHWWHSRFGQPFFQMVENFVSQNKISVMVTQKNQSITLQIYLSLTPGAIVIQLIICFLMIYLLMLMLLKKFLEILVMTGMTKKVRQMFGCQLMQQHLLRRVCCPLTICYQHLD